jgi:dTDP-4-amino-4,6-dideoxygalactose transaminase
MKPISFLDLGAMHQEIREELDAVWTRCVDTSAFIGGGSVDAFEQEWAVATGSTHAIGVANGTDALTLVLQAMGIGPGDEVIVPANTFVATAEGVTSVGATPVFCDVDPHTFLLTSDTVRPHVGPRTAAIMAVDLYGQPVNFDDLETFAASKGLAVVEDAAQSHGARWNDRLAGTLGTAATFSFYPGKNLGAFGDGGAITTDDDALATKIRSLANHGRSTTDRYRHDLDGRNSRLDALQAEILRIKLRQLPRWNAQRRAAHAWYVERLAGTGIVPVTVSAGAEAVHHLEVVLVDEREAVMAALQAKGVPTGIHYPIPCHQQLAFDQFARGELPVAEGTAGRLLSLPMHPALTEDQVDYVCASLSTIVHG